VPLRRSPWERLAAGAFLLRPRLVTPSRPRGRRGVDLAGPFATHLPAAIERGNLNPAPFHRGLALFRAWTSSGPRLSRGARPCLALPVGSSMGYTHGSKSAGGVIAPYPPAYRPGPPYDPGAAWAFFGPFWAANAVSRPLACSKKGAETTTNVETHRLGACPRVLLLRTRSAAAICGKFPHRPPHHDGQAPEAPTFPRGERREGRRHLPSLDPASDARP